MKKLVVASLCIGGLCSADGFVMPSPTATSSEAFFSRESQSHLQRSTRKSSVGLLLAANPGSPPPPFGTSPRDKPRRQKKNKYKKTTNDDDNYKDPLELLMEESRNKLQEIENKKKNKKKFAARQKSNHKNTKVITDEKEIEEIKNRPRNFVFPDNKDINPNDPASFGFIEIGTVVGAHGVHGEIKVKSSSGFPKRFTEPGIKFFKPYNKRAPRKVVLVSGRPSKDDEYIVQLDETVNREDAKRLRGGTLFVREEERNSGTTTTTTKSGSTAATNKNKNKSTSSPPEKQADKDQEQEEEEEDEFFISDLVGLEVFLEPNDEEGDDNSTPLFVGTVAGVVLGEEMCSVPGLGQDMLEINLPRGKGGTTSLRDELVLIPFVPQIVPKVSISKRTVFINPPAGLLDLTYVREEKVRIKGFLPPAATSEDDD